MVVTHLLYIIQWQWAVLASALCFIKPMQQSLDFVGHIRIVIHTLRKLINSTLNYVLIMQAVKRPTYPVIIELPNNKWSQTLMPVIILLLRWSPHIDFTEFGGDQLASFKPRLIEGGGMTLESAGSVIKTWLY